MRTLTSLAWPCPLNDRNRSARENVQGFGKSHSERLDRR